LCKIKSGSDSKEILNLYNQKKIRSHRQWKIIKKGHQNQQ